MARLRATQAPGALPKKALKSVSTTIIKKPAYNTRHSQKREINVVIFLGKKLIHERFMNLPLPQFNHILELRAKHREEFPEKYKITPPPSESEPDNSFTQWETFKTFSSAAVTTPAATPEPETESESEIEQEAINIDFPTQPFTPYTPAQYSLELDRVMQAIRHVSISYEGGRSCENERNFCFKNTSP